MTLEEFILQELKHHHVSPYHFFDKLFVSYDKNQVRRTQNICLIPNAAERRGGKNSYAEWAYVVGIFQTILYHYLANPENNVILDIGCGTGLLAIACEPFLGRQGKYLGIDVIAENIAFCQSHYPAGQFQFALLEANNSYYSPNQKNTTPKWPIADSSMDMVTALSVWTHLKEEEALFYFAEISRVLKPQGKAMITFFLLDEHYLNNLESKPARFGQFHNTPHDNLIFDQPAYGSKNWLHPKNVHIPEQAIGITTEALERLISVSGLTKLHDYPGNWKNIPGVFFQDILIFEKP